MMSAVTSSGAATTSPATGTTLTTELVARTGNATTPQPARLAAAARIAIAPSRRPYRKQWVTMSSPFFLLHLQEGGSNRNPPPFTENAGSADELRAMLAPRQSPFEWRLSTKCRPRWRPSPRAGQARQDRGHGKPGEACTSTPRRSEEH